MPRSKTDAGDISKPCRVSLVRFDYTFSGRAFGLISRSIPEMSQTDRYNRRRPYRVDGYDPAERGHIA